jgi:hypothetical protein
MCFYLEGLTLSEGALFKAAEAYSTIEAALEAANIKMGDGTAVMWIKDRQQTLVLSLQEVKERLGTPEPVKVRASAH